MTALLYLVMSYPLSLVAPSAAKRVSNRSIAEGRHA